MVDVLQCPIIVPAIQIFVQGAFRWQILGHIAPLTARAENVHDAVDEVAFISRAVASAALGRRDQRFDERPLIVGQITRVSQFVAVVSGSGRSLPHVAPHETMATRESWEIQRVQEQFLGRPPTDSYDSQTSRTDTQGFPRHLAGGQVHPEYVSDPAMHDPTPQMLP